MQGFSASEAPQKCLQLLLHSFGATDFRLAVMALWGLARKAMTKFRPFNNPPENALCSKENRRESAWRAGEAARARAAFIGQTGLCRRLLCCARLVLNRSASTRLIRLSSQSAYASSANCPASAWMILCIAATMVAMTSGTARKCAVDSVRRCHIGDDKQNRPQARG